MAQLLGNIEHFTFSIPGVEQELKVVGFLGEEKLSTPFLYTLELACEDAELDLNACINQPALLTLIGDHDNIERRVHGLVQRMEHRGQTGRFTLFRAELVPQLNLLDLRQSSRIYQHLTVPEILKSVLKDANIGTDRYQLKLTASYTAREYCVQYRETDLDFISRLMEDEGMYYWFEHHQDHHLLVITDNATSPKAIEEPATLAFHTSSGTVDAEDSVRSFIYGAKVHSGAVTLRDFNFKKPALGMQAQTQGGPFTHLEVYDYPGGYELPEGGKHYAQVRLESLHAAASEGQGTSDCLRLLPGFRMTLAEHPRKKFNQDYLITETTSQGNQPQVLQENASGAGTTYNTTFNCLPSNIPYRSPLATHKPQIQGSQTAIVTGTAGEEIYVDEHARVKVQFHWDRQGQNNEKSSCWIRVSQLWAGASWGAMFIPRIGQEVIVDFIEGDPDRPIITGRVYHGTNKPPHSLPDEKTKSSIKSDTSQGGRGSNELRFEDLKGKEEIYLHGQKDWNTRIENDAREWIGHDRHLTVMHDQLEQVKGDKHQKVVGDHNIKIDGTLSINVGGDVQQKTAQHYAHDAGNEIHLKAGQKVVLDAGAELTIKVGGSFVKLDAGGVTVLGPQLKLNQGGSPGSGKGSSPKPPQLPQAVAKGGGAPSAAQPGAAGGGAGAGSASSRAANTAPTPGKAAPGTQASAAPGGYTMKTAAQASALTADQTLTPKTNNTPPPKIANLAFEPKIVPVGTPANLRFTVSNFNGGERATMKIYECDANGAKQLVDTVSTTLKAGTGSIQMPWTRKTEQVSQDLEQDQQDQDTGPLEYRFEVEINGTVSNPSDMLRLTKTVVFETNTDPQKKVPDGTGIILTDALGKRLQASVTKGRAEFKDVLVGPVTINLADTPKT